MDEIGTLEKRSCGECGGDLEWNASKQALVCPYCGTVGESRVGAQDGGVFERDLEEALAMVGDEGRGYRVGVVTVKCNSCHAMSVLGEERVAQRCDFCGSPAIAAVEGLKDPITPESLLPVVISEVEVRRRLREWYGSRWFTPTAMKTGAMTDVLKGVYLPYWTFDAQVDAYWEAEAGYYEYQTRTRLGANGRTETHRDRQVRWESCSGRVRHQVDDIMVPATVGVHLRLLREVEPFPTKTQLVPYDARYVRGWTVERYQVDLRKAAAEGEGLMERQVEQVCARAVPGDVQRGLEVRANYFGRTFKHVLVPVWLVHYTYGGKTYQVVVNGYTGKVAGEYPLSWVKILVFVLVVLMVIALVLRYNPM